MNSIVLQLAVILGVYGCVLSAAGSKSTFTGLNPFIYTISAVVLLGTLAIVVIITCWIRARRSLNTSTARPNGTTQDYLDYINDDEFTPLTNSEFVASLQERPPSYLESERMEMNTDTEERDNDSTAINSNSINVASLVLQLPRPPPSMPTEQRVRLEQDVTAGAFQKGAQIAPASEALNSQVGINQTTSNGRLQTVPREVENS